jgi:hypothetical protein
MNIDVSLGASLCRLGTHAGLDNSNACLQLPPTVSCVCNRTNMQEGDFWLAAMPV